MTEQEFEQKSIKLIKSMIDTIASKEYEKLASCIPPVSSWAGSSEAEKTPQNACVGFGQWLDELLAMWEEDEDKELVVDTFEESKLEKIVLRDDKSSFVCYQPTSFGTELDFWFEIELKLNGDAIEATFDVNT